MSNVAVDESSKRLSDRIGQFAPIPYSFIKQAKGLSFHARWLFVVLRYYTNGKTGLAFPSYKTIQELTGMRREMIAKSIRELEARGWLTKRKRFGNSNRYTLNIPPPSANTNEGMAVNDVSEDGGESLGRGDVVASRVAPDYEIPLSEL